MQKIVFARLFVCATVLLGATPAHALTCSSGYVQSPDAAVCLQLCTAGITTLRSGNGAITNLYASRRGSPTLNVKYNGVTCYADLIAGTTTSTTKSIHVRYENLPYHTYIPIAAPQPYSIQYGAYGVEANAHNDAHLITKYGTVAIVLDGGLWKVRIVNLTKAQAKTVYDQILTERGTAPGALLNGKWIAASALN